MSAKENVLNIFICDDEPNFCEIIGEVCKEVLASEGFEGNISVGYDGEAVISYNNHIDILVLDIDMPIVDGIRVKEELQKNEEETQIIFVTSHQERMKEAFGLKVFGFVDKTYLKNELQVMLTNLLKIYESYTMIEEEYKSKDILYIESVENYVRLHMK